MIHLFVQTLKARSPLILGEKETIWSCKSRKTFVAENAVAPDLKSINGNPDIIYIFTKLLGLVQQQKSNPRKEKLLMLS